MGGGDAEAGGEHGGENEREGVAKIHIAECGRGHRCVPAGDDVQSEPAFANEVAPELIFAQQVHVYVESGDVLLGLSTSGNSLNVIHALEVARTRGVRTIGLTGRTGGQMAALCDVCIRVPHDSTPRIQERHLPIYHALCIALENHFFGNAG